MPEFVGAIDQGTTSTRFFVFDHASRVVAHHQLEHNQVLPRPGWVEHDPLEILDRVHTVMATALRDAGLKASDLAALGITNQRETTVVWDRLTGLPYMNAIVWQDVRTAGAVSEIERSGWAPAVRDKTGLPPATYFSATKAQWILGNVDAARDAAASGRACAGTIDSWLVWNLTGGPEGGRHITDVTNASRTMLMDLRTLSWDEKLLAMFALPRQVLPQILPSTGAFGDVVVEGAGRRRPFDRGTGRPARGHDRPGLPAPGRGEEHLRHGQFSAGQHGDRDREVEQRPSQHRVLPDGRRTGRLRPGGVRGRDRRGRAVAPGPDGDHKRARERSRPWRPGSTIPVASILSPLFPAFSLPIGNRGPGGQSWA